MGKGVLLEMAGRQAVVLTPQGEFRKVPMPKGTWDIGDEVEFAEAGRPAWSRWSTVAAAAAVLLLAVAPYGYNQYALAQPVALVTVDINPSLELALNREDTVLTARGLNDDGVELLKHVDWKRHPLDEVVQAVTNEAVQEHKLDPADDSSAVVVAVAPVGDQEVPKDRADRIRDTARTAVTHEVQRVAASLGKQAQTNVAGLEITPEEKVEAEKEGVSPGRFAIFQAVKEQVPEAQLQDFVQMGPGKALKSLNVNPGEIFSQAEQKHGGEPAKEKEKGSKGEEQSQPASTQSGGNQKTNSPGKGDDKKDQKDSQPDDKGQAPKDDKQSGQQDGKGKDNVTAPPDSKGKANSDSKNKPGSDSKGKENSGSKPEKEVPGGKSDGDKKGSGEQKKGSSSEKGDTWTFFGITIEKPAFLRDKSSDTRTEASQTPTAETPRADSPGAGASAGNGSDTTSGGAPGTGGQSGQTPSEGNGRDQKQEKDAGQAQDKGQDHGKNQNKGQNGSKSDKQKDEVKN